MCEVSVHVLSILYSGQIKRTKKDCFFPKNLIEWICGIVISGTEKNIDEVIKAYGKADSDSFITHPNVQHHSLLYYVPNTNPKDSKAKGVLIFDMSSEKKVIHVSFAEWGENY